MDFRQSQPFAEYLKASGWKTEKTKNGTYVYIFHIPILGNLLRIPRPKLPIAFAEIDKIAKKNDAILIKIEPDSPSEDIKLLLELKQNGFILDRWSIEPTKTFVVDLQKSKEQLLKNMRKTWRWNIQKAKKSHIVVKESSDFNTFSELWQQNSKRKKFITEHSTSVKKLWTEFNRLKKSYLFFAYVDKKPVGAVFLIGWNKTIHLWHVAYNGSYKEKQPMYLLIWEALLYSKKRGYKKFDFEGISDSRLSYTKKLQPDYFKTGFGGEKKEYIGSFVKYIKISNSIPIRIISFIKPVFFRNIYKKIYG